MLQAALRASRRGSDAERGASPSPGPSPTRAATATQHRTSPRKCAAAAACGQQVAACELDRARHLRQSTKPVSACNMRTWALEPGAYPCCMDCVVCPCDACAASLSGKVVIIRCCSAAHAVRFCASKRPPSPRPPGGGALLRAANRKSFSLLLLSCHVTCPQSTNTTPHLFC